MFPPLTERRLVVQMLPLCTQEHSRHTNKAVAMSLLQCWLDKCLSAGLLTLKRWSCASLLVNDLTHFYPLQSFHKPLLSGGCSYSPPLFSRLLGSFAPYSPVSPHPFHPPPLLLSFYTHVASRWRKRCLFRIYFSPLTQSPSLQNQHGINKFNMNWRLMKCAPPSHPADCQPFGRRLSTELLEMRQKEGENQIIVTIRPWQATKLVSCQTADLGECPNMFSIPLWDGALSFF